MDITVKTHKAISNVGTISNKEGQSSAFTQLETILYSATSVNDVDDKPIAIANV